jgi:hypothetical protein
MEWVASAEEYIGKFGWGARGKNLGVSRMFGEGDKTSLSRDKCVASVRPRGILSGFLAIVPEKGVVYVPPIAAKVPPLRLRLRISEKLLREGAVLSAYLTRDSPRRLVIEDILVWGGRDVWSSMSFSERWGNLMKLFVGQEFRADLALSGCAVELASYVSLSALEDPGEKSVVEIVPDAPRNKRLIWMPASAPVPASASDAGFTARKEAGMGPDVYAVYRGEERLGLALVRTLAISKALRLAPTPQIPIRAEHNKTFDKWEVLEVLSSAA